MGSYCGLYIGSRDYSWKGLIPDVIGLLFHPSEYVSKPHDPEDDDDELEEQWYEHYFMSDCGSAKKRLSAFGITLDLLKTIHFWAFAFDFEDYKASLEYRCESYLEEKLGDRLKGGHIERVVRFFLRGFNQLSPDQEFQHLLEKRKCQGSKQDYLAYLDSLVGDAPRDRGSTSREFNRLEYSRNRLKEFVAKDPYDHGDKNLYDEPITGDLELDLLYEVGASIYASDDSVPIEFSFTDMVEGRSPFTEAERLSFLPNLRTELASRAHYFSLAFGNLATPETSEHVDIGKVLASAGRTARERGDLFETFTSRLFKNEPGFTVNRNVRSSDQEIDIVVLNRIDDPFWTSLQSPFLIVECRNRKRKVQAKDVRDFEIKLLNSNPLARIGIIVSLSGFTKECFTAATRSCREGYRILLADRERIIQCRNEDFSTKEWIEKLLSEQL